MSARVSPSKPSGLIAQSILGGAIPPLPQPVSVKRFTRVARASCEDNPWCLACRTQMKRNGKAPYGITKWWCNTCQYNIKAYYQRAYRVFVPRVVNEFPERPVCLTCRKPYYRKGERTWYCGHCDYSVKRSVVRRERRIATALSSGEPSTLHQVSSPPFLQGRGAEERCWMGVSSLSLRFARSRHAVSRGRVE